MRTNKSNMKGLTLVEMIIGMAVASILLTMGVPAIQTMVQNNRMITQTNKFVSNLMLARSEAVKRQAEVVVCPSADGLSCSPNWASENRIVFTDDDADGVLELADGETLLRSEAAKSGQQSWGVDAGTAIVFTRNGMVKAGSASEIKLTDQGKHKCIGIEISGRSSVTSCAG